MENLQYLLSGFATAITFTNLLYCFIGVTFGMFVGVLPGLGPTAGTALLLPLTYGLGPIPAIIMLSGIYYGAMYGGTITSVLINTPGEAASVITCLDGYPLAKQGRAGVALGTSAIGSFIGGTISIIGLSFLGPVVARQALKFGPPEFFCLMFMGLTFVIGLMGKSLLKGFIAALLGISLSMIGTDPSAGIIRFSFGISNLMGGIDFVTIAMGMFGLSEVYLTLENDLNEEVPIPNIKGLFPRKEEWPPVLKSIGRGSILGFLIGLIPGTNSAIPTIISYSLEKKLSRHPERFGNGAIEGVAGPETANNAYCGGALIPLFTLGIPTAPVIAVLLGAFIMHGLTPGPTLFEKEPVFVWTVIASMFVGNAILLIMNLPLASLWAKIAKVPNKIMFPIIIIIAILGVYGINNSLWDVGVMFVFGFLGYLFKKAKFPLAPLILTYVLGDTLEFSLVQSMVIFRGNILLFFQRPICAVLLIITFTFIIFSIISGSKGSKQKNAFADEDIEM